MFPPPNNIPWKLHKSKNIEALFEFAFAYLIDDGPLLLFVHGNKDVRNDMRIFVASYEVVLQKEWRNYNKLPLCFSLNASLTIHFKLYKLMKTQNVHVKCIM